MNTKSAILSAAERIDAWFPHLLRQQTTESRRLVELLVHTVYEKSSDPDSAGVFPHERITVAQLREFIELFLEMGYTFVAPVDVVSQRLPDKAMMLTFDDGYYNFVRALPLLQEYRVPATLFICPGYVVEPRSFWWDAFYRAARATGSSEQRIRRELALLRTKPFNETYKLVTERCGPRALEVASDADRPLTMDELQDLAGESLVHIGNHTFNHVALPFLGESEIRQEITSADEFISREFGATVKAIAYPNGDHSDTVIAVCAELGYQLGLTIEPRWNTDADLSQPGFLSLGRYMLSGEREIGRQAASVNLPSSLSSAIRGCKRHRYN